MPTTPNMSLILPTPDGDVGTWDDKLNAALTLVDGHDHSTGEGVQIPTGGIADGAITTAKLADTAVTPGTYTLATVTVDQKGRITGASSGSSGGGVPDTREVIAGAGITGGGALSSDVTLNVGANADGSIVVNANDIQVGVLATDVQHGVRGGGNLHNAAVAGGASGFMTGADKTKLDGVAAGATANAAATNLPAAVGTAAVGVATAYAREDHVHAHGNQAGGALHADVVAGGASGFMTGTQATKLDGIASGATANTAATNAPPATASASALGAETRYAREDHTHQNTLLSGKAGGQTVVGGVNDGNALYLRATTSGTGEVIAQRVDAGTNDVQTAFRIERVTSGTAANGYGLAVPMSVEAVDGTSPDAAVVRTKWTNATTKTAELAIALNSAGTVQAAGSEVFQLQPHGLGIGAAPNASYHLHVQQALFPNITVEATTNDTTNAAVFRGRAGSSTQFTLQAFGSSFTPTGAKKASAAYLAANNAGGLSIVAENAAGDLRLYAGGNADANNYLEISDAGLFTAKNAGKRAVVSGAATTTVSLTGLDGNTWRAYHITGRIKNATAVETAVRLRPNGVTTNLRSQFGQVKGGTIAGAAETSTWYLGVLRASGELFFDVTVWCKTGLRRCWTGTSMGHYPTTPDITEHWLGGTWDETATNITSFDVLTDAASSIDIGSEIYACVPDFLVGA